MNGCCRCFVFPSPSISAFASFHVSRRTRCLSSLFVSASTFARDRKCNLVILRTKLAQGQPFSSHTRKERKIFGVNATQMRENVWTVPNALSMLRIGLTPVLGYLVLHDFHGLACGIFILAGLTDLLDGYIARHYPSQQSVLGSALDPVADKFLVATLFLSLTYTDLIPVALTALIIARDICLMSAGFYVRYITLDPPKTLARFFDLTQPTVRMLPTTISKANTAVQLGLVAVTLAAPVFGYVGHPLLHAYWWFTAASTVVSGLSYALQRDTFRPLKKND